MDLDGDWDVLTTETASLSLGRLEKQRNVNVDTSHLLAIMQQNIDAILEKYPQAPLFFTSLHGTDQVTNAFIAGLSEDDRLTWRCNRCHRFLQSWGDISLILPDSGELLPLLWTQDSAPLPAAYQSSALAVARLFETARITRDFRVYKTSYGMPESRGWRHFTIHFPEKRIRKASAGGVSIQNVAELARMLERVTIDYAPQHVQRAEALLYDKLYRGRELVDAVSWLSTVFRLLDSCPLSETRRHNLLCHIAVSAPIGWVGSLRSGILSTLLTNIKDGVSDGEIYRTWSSQTHPLNYMRPKAPPRVGGVVAAEKLFGTLNLTSRDLQRRFCTIQDIPKNVFLYSYQPNIAAMECPVFGSLMESAVRRENASCGRTERVSFVKFAQEVLPRARLVEVWLSYSEYLFWFITGLEGTKPIMQWHTENNRVSWFTPLGRLSSHEHGLGSGWNTVTSIVPFPNLWTETSMVPLSDLCEAPQVDTYNQVGSAIPEAMSRPKIPFSQQGVHFLISLKNLARRDTDSLCLFPEFLKSELHGARRVIEAYSKNGRVRMTEGNVLYGGICFDRTMPRSCLFKVTDQRGCCREYRVDSFQ